MAVHPKLHPFIIITQVQYVYNILNLTPFDGRGESRVARAAPRSEKSLKGKHAYAIAILFALPFSLS